MYLWRSSIVEASECFSSKAHLCSRRDLVGRPQERFRDVFFFLEVGPANPFLLQSADTPFPEICPNVKHTQKKCLHDIHTWYLVSAQAAI